MTIVIDAFRISIRLCPKRRNEFHRNLTRISSFSYEKCRELEKFLQSKGALSSLSCDMCTLFT
jgi:hypothetical protein